MTILVDHRLEGQTAGSADRLDERDYRERCASRLVEILVDLDQYLGAGGLYVP